MEFGVLGIIVLVSLVMSLVTIFGRPDKPMVEPFYSVARAPPGSTMVPDLLRKETGFFDVISLSLHENTKNCGGHCTPANYDVKITTSAGLLRFAPEKGTFGVRMNQNKVVPPKGYELSFYGNLNSVNAALDALEVKPICPFKPVTVVLTVVITVIPDGIGNGLIVTANSGEYVDIYG